ncbi:hypothetical protein HDU85_002688 [Gaertneriomyces sp. JEL0708]|nr:hypothetical protein HDU85_002688 [Gaertneriomyces sp. JEL0708]
MIYGEIMSLADQTDKQLRHDNCKKQGKHVDYLYKVQLSTEMGVGENSGPQTLTHHDHARENFVDLCKTTKAQIEVRAATPSGLTSIKIPFFHVVGNTMYFFIASMIPGVEDLLVVYEWCAAAWPQDKSHTAQVADLAEAFLLYRSLLKAQHKIFRKAKRASRIGANLPSRRNSFVGVKTPSKKKVNQVEVK